MHLLRWHNTDINHGRLTLFLKQRFGHSLFWAPIAHNMVKYSNVFTLHFSSRILVFWLHYLARCSMAPPRPLGTCVSCLSQVLSWPNQCQEKIFRLLHWLSWTAWVWLCKGQFSSQSAVLESELQPRTSVVCISEFYIVFKLVRIWCL